MALGTGVIADYLKSRNKISTTAIRKTFTTFGEPWHCLLPSLELEQQTERRET